MSQIIFDIETIGENFDDLDKTSQHMLTRWIERTAKNEEEYKAHLKDVREGLGFSPLTGQIVAIGVLDGQTEKGAVYFDIQKESIKEFEENNIKFKPSTEVQMLEKFWEIAGKYNEFVTFNGKKFDVPFIMIRSAINRIKPTKHLLSNRYLTSQRFDAKHVDLFDELSFYGNMQMKGNNLHMWTRAFGIESPKSKGVDGDDVAMLFKEKKYLDIARYNSLDLIATKKLYDIWNKYLRI